MSINQKLEPEYSTKHHGSIYRFFKKECEAEALISGNVWISTLEVCRAYENAEQGDAEEAQESYNSGHAVGHGDNQDIIEIAKRCGMDFGLGCKFEPGSKLDLSNNQIITKIQDAYVLCTATEYSPDIMNDSFGSYCVEITDIKIFFNTVVERLNEKSPLRWSAANKVLYQSRYYKGLEAVPGPIGFVKPERYFPQKEFRFLLIPALNTDIKPFLLECPEVSKICKRIF